MLIKTNTNTPTTDTSPREVSVKQYHLKFISAGVSAPIVPESQKGIKITTIKARACPRGCLPRIKTLGSRRYLPVCQNRRCRCPHRTKMLSQPSQEQALLEWNKYRPIRSSDDLFHPTVKVNHLPLREIKLNLSVEQMYIDRFLAKFNRGHLTEEDRKVFVLREKWLEVVKYQLNKLECR
ncbi:hypothetical protein SG34_005000 [Thalassomonas viridans]|uniref:Uncharacterized protein n=1 Tax=Thalassomonas viridans TaxID=137584 RepID=A0AAF0CAG6_9GAMM|nr:hypothetical protein [Thalassomonas viridans]WDE06285.1 hypothetical protein SG34_005000 [Thalassomonas viridans]